MRPLRAIPLVLLLAAFAFAEPPVTVYLVGDSTMAQKVASRRPETGWGEALQQYFDIDRVRVENHARNGRSTRSFIAEGRWRAVLDELRPGDYVLIQFGHNDAAQNRPERYTPPEEYRANLRRMVAEVRAKQARPVLLTPVASRKFNDAGVQQESRGVYPAIVREVAAEVEAPLLDLYRRSTEVVQRYGPEGSRKLFLQLAPGEHPNYPEGVEDNTHFSPLGAEVMAAHVVEEMRLRGLPLAELAQLPAPAARLAYDFVVAQDGSGDFRTIQEAVNAVRDYTPIPRTIFIRNGVYREKLLIPTWKTGITLVGESVEKTIVEWGDYSGKDGINTFTSYTARVSGNDIHVRNVTFRNTAGPVGQAVALFVEGDRVVFDNCRFEGNQDTIFAAGEGARQYFRDVYVEGTTDFIFGPATAYFERCEIRSRRDSYITAASTPAGIPFGFVFDGCRLTAEPEAKQVYLGRPWRDHARTVFLRSEMGAHIRPEGWHNWSRPEAERTVLYAEYANTGPSAAREGRVPWSRELTAEEAARYTRENVLCGGSCGERPWYEPIW